LAAVCKISTLAELQPAPREGNIEVKMGHVCFIPETKDFFIAYGDHPEWANSHTVRWWCKRGADRWRKCRV
jgi:hypothetical protein